MIEHLNIMVVESEDPAVLQVVLPNGKDELVEAYEKLWNSKEGKKLRVTLVQLDYGRDGLVEKCVSKIIPDVNPEILKLRSKDGFKI